MTLELGIAMGKDLCFYILWNPGLEQDQPPADLGGIDRIDIDELNHALRCQLRSHGRDYARPIELVNEHVANQHRPANA